MAMTIHCDIVSAEAELFSGRAKLIVANGTQGDLGVTYGHAPLLTSLEPGPVRIVQDNGEEIIFYVSGGFLEVQPNVVSILADTAMRAGDLDEAAALEAQKHAQQAMLNQSADVDYSRAAAQLAAASAQRFGFWNRGDWSYFSGQKKLNAKNNVVASMEGLECSKRIIHFLAQNNIVLHQKVPGTAWGPEGDLFNFV